MRKYRICLILLMVAILIAGAMSYLYFYGRDKTYKDGTLVQLEWENREELV